MTENGKEINRIRLTPPEVSVDGGGIGISLANLYVRKDKKDLTDAIST
jgi:hypothetical protein